MYDHLSLVSLRLRGTRSRNKRACLLRFESADLSYLSLRRTPVVGTLAPARRGGGQLFEKSEWFTRAPASTTTANIGVWS